MTLLLSRSNNFSRHALIFPLRISTTGGSDAVGTGRTDQRVRTRGLNPQVRAHSQVLEPDRVLSVEGN